MWRHLSIAFLNLLLLLFSGGFYLGVVLFLGLSFFRLVISFQFSGLPSLYRFLLLQLLDIVFKDKLHKLFGGNLIQAGQL